MKALAHMLNIGTLASWLSVAGFGSVAIIVPSRPPPAVLRPAVTETQWIPQEITLGVEAPPAAAEPAMPTTPAPETEDNSLPDPPPLPDLTAMEPLPDIPAPPPPPAPDTIREQATTSPRPAARPATTGASPRSSVRNHSAAGTAAASGRSGGSAGLSDGARLAAGSMPSPSYPAEARRLGQTGTLVVEFTVDSSGRVIAAYAVTPSPWPLLNQEAVRTVRRWKFPPGGGVMKLQRPIIFQLR